MRIVYLTDGHARTVQVGKQRIALEKTTPRQRATAGRISGTVIQALRWLGQEHVSEATITRLKRHLSAGDKKQLLRDLRYAPAWVARILRRVARESEV